MNVNDWQKLNSIWNKRAEAIQSIQTNIDHELSRQDEIAQLDEAIDWACNNQNVEPDSGLIKQQLLFAKIRTTGVSD